MTTSGGDPLRRRDAAPEGVPAQLTFLLPVTDSCGASHPSPDVEIPSERNEIGDSVEICIRGFDQSSEVVVEVAVPGGETRQRLVRNVDDQNFWLFKIGLMDPIGSYSIRAVQGASRATGAFTAVLPAKPRIETLEPTSGAPGSVFRFAVVSPAPNQTLFVDLYRQERGRNPVYTATLGTLVTDARARASYQVPTRSDSPAGQYCLVVRPFANSCASFTLR